MSAAEILDAARVRKVRIATAESCTGGMVCAALTEVPGASDVVEECIVTYSNHSKTRLLGVSPGTLEDCGAVSERTAREMAEGALEGSAADLAVSVTGIAGPGGSGSKPEGRVCFAIAMRGKPARTETREFGALGRAEVRRRASEHALAMLLAALR